MSITQSNFTDFFVEVIKPGINELWFQNRPFLNRVKKAPLATVTNSHTMHVHDGVSVSGTASTSFAATSTTLYERGQVDVAEWYNLAYISYKDWLAGKGNKNLKPLADLAKRELKAKGNALLNRVAQNAFSSTVGASGVISSISGTDITLTNQRDHRNFTEGQVLQVASTDGSSGAVRTGSVTISTIARKNSSGNCVITCSANVTSGISAAVAGDYIFKSGDFGKGFYGLGYQLSATSGTIYGVDVSTSSKLQGVPISISGDRIEGLMDAADEVADVGEGAPTDLFLNPKEFNVLAKGLESVTTRVPGPRGEIGVKTLVLNTNAGQISVWSDPAVEETAGFLLDMDTIELLHEGSDLVHVQEEFGMIPASNADYFSIRLASYPAIRITQPCRNGYITFS